MKNRLDKVGNELYAGDMVALAAGYGDHEGIGIARVVDFLSWPVTEGSKKTIEWVLLVSRSGKTKYKKRTEDCVRIVYDADKDPRK